MDRRLTSIVRSIGGGLKAAGLSVMRFAGRGLYWAAVHVPGSRIPWERVGDGRHNSIVEAVFGWVGRNFPEAPIIVRQYVDGEWSIVEGHPLSALIERPNPSFSGVLMLTAVAINMLGIGEAYIVKVRNSSDNVIELWWVPNEFIQPMWPQDGSVFISHYEYRPIPGVVIRLDVRDVVHLRDGIDPHNIRHGRSRMASVLREVFTDDEAAAYTAALLTNMGIPGTILAPEDPNANVDPDTVAQTFKEKFGGDKRGEAMVMTGPTKITTLSFNPQQMDLRALRRIPEERVSAVFGVAAIVAGLGAGLDRSTFANFAEARQAAYEECIIPLQRVVAAELEVQLLPDFETDAAAFDVDFDLSDVRVLAEDVDALWKRYDMGVRGGWITVATAKKAVGVPVDDGDDVYLRPLNIVTSAAGAPDVTQEAPVQLEAIKSAPRLTTAAGMKAARRAAPGRALAKRLQEVIGPRLRRDLERYFATFADRILPTVKSIGRKGGDLFDVEGIDWGAEEDELRAILVRAYGTVGDEVYRALAAEAGVDVSFDFNGKGSRKVLDFIGSQVKGIVETTRAELAAAVEEARQRGYTVRQLRDGVVPGDFTGDRADESFTGLRDLMQSWADVPGGESRAGLIARTELAYANNLTSNAAYRDSGLVEQVEVFDGDGDEECAAANGQIWSLDEADANPIEHPNCQRAFAPIFVSASEAA